jgi:hypothetical protein
MFSMRGGNMDCLSYEIWAQVILSSIKKNWKGGQKYVPEKKKLLGKKV